MKRMTVFTLVSTLIGVFGLTGIAQAVSTNLNSATIPSFQVHRTSSIQGSKAMILQANQPRDGRVPSPLVKVAANAEAIYDFAQISDWTTATTSLNALKLAAKQLQKVDVETTQLDIVIAELNKAIVAKNRLAAIREANQVTRIAANLTRQFNPKVPVEITLLDYDGRELEIWSEVKNRAKLKTTAANLRQNWDSVRPLVENHGGKIQAKQFEILVTRVESARSFSDYSHLATPVLNAVDKLEGLFK